MQIFVRQHGRLKLSRLSRDRIGKRGRDYRVERTVSLFDPYAIQRSKTRCAKGPSCAFESLIAPRLRAPPCLEEPPQFVQLRRAKRHSDLLPKGIVVTTGRVHQVVRNENAHRPRRKRSEQLRVAFEEHSEIDRHWPCRQVHKHVRATVFAKADR